MTKKEALKKSGYQPVIGRPTIGSDEMGRLTIYLSKKTIAKIPHPRQAWLRDKIESAL